MTTVLSSQEIVQRYLEYFRRHGHYELTPSPLAVPGNSTSFIIAGMQPLLPYLRGLEMPPSPRLSSLQRCLRTDDADAVGINGRKISAFTMLGNWSIGDYWKREAIEMAMEMLVEHLGLDVSRFWVSVYAGDESLGLPQDDEAIREWQRVGMPDAQIVALGTEDNLWTMGDGPGPCGPCSEIYVDRGSEWGCGRATCRPGCDCERFLEVWNLVFMQYERHVDGTMTELPLRNIDTGMGLERMAMALQGSESIFSIDLFQPALECLRELAPEREGEMPRTRRMIVDHARAVMLAGLVGVGPGRTGRDSVVRRLIRRAARQGYVLGIERPFLSELLRPLMEGHGDLLTPEEREKVPALAQMMEQEERMFSRVLSRGLPLLERLRGDERGYVDGEEVYKLHSDRGFPTDLVVEILAEKGLSVDWQRYEQAREEHSQVSRRSVESHFQQ
ncbi:alanine--tRNA ligase-related protein [Ktedonospora formicarum]|uniref:alanine--tRNA ligase n=1 Tax=Ktedonospora formicarum TaxID=2778364 RepID=A0A8J3I0I1_9CHLR|nr:alanine--tRNA ligase-related protein [Ktedonospora formicarum]GHO45361.1 hypothetical protein KSX_35240 [Ktedonospora formicarum]